MNNYLFNDINNNNGLYNNYINNPIQNNPNNYQFPDAPSISNIDTNPIINTYSNYNGIDINTDYNRIIIQKANESYNLVSSLRFIMYLF